MIRSEQKIYYRQLHFSPTHEKSIETKINRLGLKMIFGTTKQPALRVFDSWLWLYSVSSSHKLDFQFDL